MVWFRTDDSFPSHPKVRSIPRANRLRVLGVWLCCGNWSAHHLTDGRVPADVVLDEGGRAADASALVAAGLWHRDGHECERCPQPGPGAYQFHDWPVYQKTREQVLAERKKTADRVADFRKRRRTGAGNGVTPDESADEYGDGNRAGSGVTPSLVTLPPARTRPEEQMTPDGVISSELALRPDDRPDVERVCRHLADRIEANGSRRPTVGKGWRDAARLLMDRDGITEAQIHAAIEWCQDDDFWRSNILSMPKLREKYDQLRLAARRAAGSATPSGQRLSPGDRALMLATNYTPGTEAG